MDPLTILIVILLILLGKIIFLRECLPVGINYRFQGKLSILKSGLYFQKAADGPMVKA